MRIRTHALFSFGMSMWYLAYFTPNNEFQSKLLSLLHIPDPYPIIAITFVDLILCYFFAHLLNAFIDIAGHRVIGGGGFIQIRRSYRTHEIFICLFWGVSIPLAIIAIPSWIFGMGFPSEWNIVLWICSLGALICFLHLALDVFTPDGIYITKTKHFNFARLSYNSISYNIINKILIGTGVLLAFLAVIYLNDKFVILSLIHRLIP